ncbi:MAG: hypothetical protein ACKV2U_11075 [Bryobacteraceae bacterium]
MTNEPNHEVAEERQSLWLLVLSPSIWAAHFLVSYAAAAIWCGAVAGRDREVDVIRMGIFIFGSLALVCVGAIGKIGWRKYKLDGGDPPFDKDTAEDRHRFLGAATVLLSALSAVAIAYVCLSLLFVRDCR